AARSGAVTTESEVNAAVKSVERGPRNQPKRKNRRK
ncbi:MAG: hypothetical protein RL622_265, partial [Actinomycetota bacterium]